MRHLSSGSTLVPLWGPVPFGPGFPLHEITEVFILLSWPASLVPRSPAQSSDRITQDANLAQASPCPIIIPLWANEPTMQVRCPRPSRWST